MIKDKYEDRAYSEFKYLFNDKLILLVTATELETKSLHSYISPIPKYGKIIRIFEGDLTYYIGIFGLYVVAHIQTTMGSVSRESSIASVKTALGVLKSNVVIMIGIAFGTNEKDQNIGDVLISESIIPYNSKRVGTSATIHRGIEAPCSKVLLNRFRNIMLAWDYKLNNEIKAKVIITRLLSGEELIDNKSHRDQLLSKFPESKGGEMEGAGLYAACDGIARWIIVKGICDFADGKKSVNKIKRQKIAVNSALNLCVELFLSKTAFNEFFIKPFEQENYLENSIINNVLFDMYDETKDSYYIIRNDDEIFLKTLKRFGIWMYGPSGCGKSNLILRNLIKSNCEFLQIGLASYIDMEINSYFDEILCELASKVNEPFDKVLTQDYISCSKQIIYLLNKYYYGKELIIFIEEIPISSKLDYHKFATRIFSLLSLKNLNGGLENVKFVLSSINNPTQYIEAFQKKTYQLLQFIGLENWKETDINELINLIENYLRLNTPETVIEKLKIRSKNSPRFVKKFYRNYLVFDKPDIKKLEFLIEETERDLN